MNFNTYMYGIIESEIERGLANGKKIHCRAFIKKRVIQTLIFGIILAVIIFAALSKRGNESALFFCFPVLIIYFWVLYLTPFVKTVLKLCRKKPDTAISAICDKEVFKCTH